jgi:hypothetical protein
MRRAPQVVHFINNLDSKDTLEPLGYETKSPKAAKERSKSRDRGREREREPEKPKDRRPPGGRVIVVGAGPSGLAAASVLKVGAGGGTRALAGAATGRGRAPAGGAPRSQLHRTAQLHMPLMPPRHSSARPGEPPLLSTTAAATPAAPAFGPRSATAWT